MIDRGGDDGAERRERVAFRAEPPRRRRDDGSSRTYFFVKEKRTITKEALCFFLFVCASMSWIVYTSTYRPLETWYSSFGSPMEPATLFLTFCTLMVTSRSEPSFSSRLRWTTMPLSHLLMK